MQSPWRLLGKLQTFCKTIIPRGLLFHFYTILQESLEPFGRFEFLRPISNLYATIGNYACMHICLIYCLLPFILFSWKDKLKMEKMYGIVVSNLLNPRIDRDGSWVTLVHNWLFFLFSYTGYIKHSVTLFVMRSSSHIVLWCRLRNISWTQKPFKR